MHRTPTYRNLFVVTLFLSIFAATPAFAQDDQVKDVTDDVDGASKEFEPGLDIGLTIGANFNLSSNSSVIGQPDGSSYTLGANLDFDLNYATEGNYEIRNELLIRETFTRTPVLPEFVRTVDQLALDSVSYYHLTKGRWAGLFGRFNLQTSIFEGFDVQPEGSEYIISRADGTTEQIGDLTVEDGGVDRLKLTDSFAPMSLRESVGGFLRPLDGKWLRVEFRSGLGARQVFADGQLSLDDDPDTDTIEITELSSFSQVGLENVILADGAIFGKRVAYRGSIETLTPFYNSVVTPEAGNKGNLALTNIDVTAAISFKLVDWASLDYEFRAIKQPALLDEFQIQNNFLLTFGYTLFEADN